MTAKSNTRNGELLPKKQAYSVTVVKVLVDPKKGIRGIQYTVDEDEEDPKTEQTISVENTTQLVQKAGRRTKTRRGRKTRGKTRRGRKH